MRRIGGSLALLLAAAGLAGTLALAPGVRVLTAQAKESAIRPPVARIVPKLFTEHGRRRIDNYDWLRKRDDPRVIAYLAAENAYANARLARIKPLTAEIAAELKTRSAVADVSVPYFNNGYFYEGRFSEGAQYPVIVRRKGGADAAEQVVLDVGALAAGHAQYHVGDWTVSPDGARIAFAVDFTGNGIHRIFLRTIATGEIIDDDIDGADTDLVFSADGQMLFYVRLERKTLRAHQVWRHRIGTDATTDVLVYEERDPTFSVSLQESKSRKFILLSLDQERTSEVRFLPSDRPLEQFRVIEPRRRGVRYDVDHVGEKFYILTNLDAPDFRLMTAPQDASAAAHWSELIAEQPGHYLFGFEVFDRFIAVNEDHDAMTSVRVFRLADSVEIAIPRAPAIGVASAGAADRDPSSTVLRLYFSGPLQPENVYDFDMATGALTLRKESPATRWFRPQDYVLERIFAVAPDHERIPVTLVYRKSLRKSGGNPTLVSGYGAYGSSSRPEFQASWFSLIDHGFVFAVAHVRGGREYGQRWHDQGRMLNKRNTFTDFIAATEALIAQGYADPKVVFAHGASAGGLLVGAVANMRPDLYAGIVANVPFVDVLTTMSDPSIPLTTFEYEEWGNPAVREQYDYMRSYSPYDNVKAQAYPAMFVIAGFHDSEVSYAEPAKWVARLRATRTDGHELLFKTNMEVGHAGASGRLGLVDEQAEIIAWLIARATATR
jgi:oligopeptidase B